MAPPFWIVAAVITTILGDFPLVKGKSLDPATPTPPRVRVPLLNLDGIRNFNADLLAGRDHYHDPSDEFQGNTGATLRFDDPDSTSDPNPQSWTDSDDEMDCDSPTHSTGTVQALNGAQNSSEHLDDFSTPQRPTALTTAPRRPLRRPRPNVGHDSNYDYEDLSDLEGLNGTTRSSNILFADDAADDALGQEGQEVTTSLPMPAAPVERSDQRIRCRHELPDNSFLPSPFSDAYYRNAIGLHDSTGLCAGRPHGGNAVGNMGGYCDQSGTQAMVKFDETRASPRLFSRNDLKLWCESFCACHSDDLSPAHKRQRRVRFLDIGKDLALEIGGHDVVVAFGSPVTSRGVVIPAPTATGYAAKKAATTPAAIEGSKPAGSPAAGSSNTPVNPPSINSNEQSANPPPSANEPAEGSGQCPAFCSSAASCQADSAPSGSDVDPVPVRPSSCAVCHVSDSGVVRQMGLDPVFPPGRCMPVVLSAVSWFISSLVPRDGGNTTATIPVCACNATYTSHGCCGQEDGIVHERAGSNMGRVDMDVMWKGGRRARPKASSCKPKQNATKAAGGEEPGAKRRRGHVSLGDIA